ncbi:MAG: hypothetical protein ACLU4N_20615 [Butyricimonas faecihominis]
MIENVEKEDVAKDPDYTVIRGSALVLLHFDLMRLFCDNIKINSGAGGFLILIRLTWRTSGYTR